MDPSEYCQPLVFSALGYILTAWATAGVVGPLFVAWVRDKTGSYEKTLYLFGGLFVVALIMSVLMMVNVKQLRAKHPPAAADI